MALFIENSIIIIVLVNWVNFVILQLDLIIWESSLFILLDIYSLYNTLFCLFVSFSFVHPLHSSICWKQWSVVQDILESSFFAFLFPIVSLKDRPCWGTFFYIIEPRSLKYGSRMWNWNSLKFSSCEIFDFRPRYRPMAWKPCMAWPTGAANSSVTAGPT